MATQHSQRNREHRHEPLQKNPPRDLNADGRMVWRLIANNPHVGAGDRLVVYGMCRWFQSWKSEIDAGEIARASSCWKNVITSIGKLGMSPKDRAEIKKTLGAAVVDEIENEPEQISVFGTGTNRNVG